MTDTHDAPTSSAARPTSREDLYELYGLLIDALVTIFKDTPAGRLRASMLDVARKVVRDAGVAQELATAAQARAALEQLKDEATGLDSFLIPFPTVEQ